jgi:hypothetical protein
MGDTRQGRGPPASRFKSDAKRWQLYLKMDSESLSSQLKKSQGCDFSAARASDVPATKFESGEPSGQRDWELGSMQEQYENACPKVN